MDLDCAFTVLVMGERGVGKSTLGDRFSLSKFYRYMLSKYNCSLCIEVKEIHQMPDGTIDAIYGPLYSLYKGAVAAILVYDVTKRFTYEQVKLLVPILRQYHRNDPYFQIMLVGNKKDLCSKNLDSILSLDILDYRKKEISTDNLKDFAARFQYVYCRETSAIKSTNLDSVYSFFFERIYITRIVNTVARGIRTHVGAIMPSIRYEGEKAGAGNITHYDYLFKVLVLGPPCVGKSNLVSRFMNNVFHLSYIPTYGYELSIGSLVLDGKTILAQICDLAGQGRYKPSRLASSTGYDIGNLYEGVSGILCVYSVGNIFSFEAVKKVGFREMRRLHGPHIPILLVGNQSDPFCGPRQVPMEYAEDFAEKKSLYFMETSAWDPIIKFQECAIFSFFMEIYRLNIEKANEKIDLASSTSEDGNNLATQFEGIRISNNEAPETTQPAGISGAKYRNDQASIAKAGPSIVQGIAAIDGGEVNMNNAENNLNFGRILNNNFNFGKNVKAVVIMKDNGDSD